MENNNEESKEETLNSHNNVSYSLSHHSSNIPDIASLSWDEFLNRDYVTLWDWDGDENGIFARYSDAPFPLDENLPKNVKQTLKHFKKKENAIQKTKLSNFSSNLFMLPSIGLFLYVILFSLLTELKTATEAYVSLSISILFLIFFTLAYKKHKKNIQELIVIPNNTDSSSVIMLTEEEKSNIFSTDGFTPFRTRIPKKSIKIEYEYAATPGSTFIANNNVLNKSIAQHLNSLKSNIIKLDVNYNKINENEKEQKTHIDKVNSYYGIINDLLENEEEYNHVDSKIYNSNSSYTIRINYYSGENYYQLNLKNIVNLYIQQGDWDKEYYYKCLTKRLEWAKLHKLPENYWNLKTLEFEKENKSNSDDALESNNNSNTILKRAIGTYTYSNIENIQTYYKLNNENILLPGQEDWRIIFSSLDSLPKEDEETINLIMQEFSHTFDKLNQAKEISNNSLESSISEYLWDMFKTVEPIIHEIRTSIDARSINQVKATQLFLNSRFPKELGQ